MTGSLPAEHFQALYRGKDDPWDFVSSPYEQAKYRHTLAALGTRRFQSTLEVGCSIGVLSRMLADRSDRFLGLDIVEDPLPAARTRCADQPWARFEQMAVPATWPEGMFDLIVFSEVLYFLSAADIDRCAERAFLALRPSGFVVLVNWLGSSDDPTPGGQAAERFVAARPWLIVRREQETSYRLDVLAGA